jgi:hypothetical protein
VTTLLNCHACGTFFNAPLNEFLGTCFILPLPPEWKTSYFRPQVGETMTTNEILTIVALVAGPVMSVFITRYLDDTRAYKSRRMDVFRTLMRTRRTVLSPEHIGALNLVEIEFAKDPSVLTAHKALFTHFGTAHGRRENEKIEGLSDKSEIDRRSELFGTRLSQERQSALAKLLHAMAGRLVSRLNSSKYSRADIHLNFGSTLRTNRKSFANLLSIWPTRTRYCQLAWLIIDQRSKSWPKARGLPVLPPPGSSLKPKQKPDAYGRPTFISHPRG